MSRFLVSIAAAGVWTFAASADELIVPPGAPAGTGSYSTLLHAQPRSYQLVVGPGALQGLPFGSKITGITWRRPSWQVFADWPGAGFSADWQNYDIYLSSSLAAVGALSSTYTDNIAGDVVLCRSGPISIAGAFFPGGALTPATNPFGAVIPFTTPYTYTGANGGTLLLTVRADGNDVGASGNLDWVSSPGNGQAIGVSSYTQETDWYPQGNNGMVAFKITFDPPAGGCPADIDGSGCVDQIDLNAVLAAFNTCANQADYNPAANLAPGPVAACGGDEGINQDDLNVLLSDFACGCP